MIGFATDASTLVSRRSNVGTDLAEVDCLVSINALHFERQLCGDA